jgi:hypothetical protein
MEPDRFDDVAFTVEVEHEPLSPRAVLRRRVAGVLAAAIVGFGGLAAAADALTSSGSSAPPAKTAMPGSRPYFFDSDRVRTGHPCHRGEGMPGEMHRFDQGRGDDSSLRY